MITLEQQQDWLQQQLEAFSPAPSGIDWLDRFRDQARSALSRQPLMDRKSEAWRYTRVERLLGTVYASPRNGFEPGLEDLKAYDLPELDGYRLVFHNGNYLPQLSLLDGLPCGVELGSLHSHLATNSSLIAAQLGKDAVQSSNLFTTLNSYLIDNGLLLHIDSGVKLDRPIQVIHISDGNKQPVMIQPRHLLVLDSGAKATLVEHFVGNRGSGYFHNSLAEVIIGEDATLVHYRLQTEADDSHHLGSLYLQQKARSHYTGATLSFGGAWARTDYNTVFAGEHAECLLSGLCTVGDEQLGDFHLDVQHNIPNCISREHFKGIAHGQGRAVFDGRVLVDKQAQHSNAEMRNDNLMLNRKAEIDTKPQLEIYADDVKCSHGTTVGQIEPEQLFYLRSRGIGTEAAKRMLCQGFAGEIIDGIEPEALRDYAYGKLVSALANAISEEQDQCQ